MTNKDVAIKDKERISLLYLKVPNVLQVCTDSVISTLVLTPGLENCTFLSVYGAVF